MRPLIFLFPNDRMDIGGNSAQVRFVDACIGFTQAKVVYYGDRLPDQPHLDDVLAEAGSSPRPIFVIHWGPDIAMLIARLVGEDVVYIAHSTGWGMALPPRVPILCVSRNTMGYWGRHAPNSYIAHVPNVVSLAAVDANTPRDIDVLVQSRKSSRYLLERLVPALQDRCHLTLLDGWVPDLAAVFRRSKVYLYDSLEHWMNVGATEGFGLPPLEAMSQGCVVFSSVNDALADYLDPALNCRKIRVHSLEYDVAAILRAVAESTPAPPAPAYFSTYSHDTVTVRLQTLFGDLESFFDLIAGTDTDIDDLWALRRPTPLQRAKRAVKVLIGA